LFLFNIAELKKKISDIRKSGRTAARKPEATQQFRVISKLGTLEELDVARRHELRWRLP
jgi:hypothetical protein